MSCCNSNCNQGRTCTCEVAPAKTTAAIPLCQDCAHYELDDYEDFCLHEKSLISVNLVNGRKTYKTCIMMRQTAKDQCSHAGLFFQPAETKKTSIIQFFKNLF